MGELQFHGVSATVFVAYPLRLTEILHPVFGLGLPLQTASPLNSLLIIRGLLDGFTTDDKYVAMHLLRHICTIYRIPIYVSYENVIIRLFIRISAAIHHSPAYLFATGSAPVLSSVGASWMYY